VPRWLAVSALGLVVLGGVGAAQLLRPVPLPRPVFELASSYTVPGPPLRLPFPAAGQAALYLEGTGWVGRTPGQTPVAIASVTKLMTALLVVEAHPLQPGQAGPVLTMTAEDQAVYQEEAAAGDSVVPVRAGESLSELQLLEGLLLPSGDNLARVLAQWVSGSDANFVSAMNRKAKLLGMDQTVYADASGLDPGSISTASDLTMLAVQIMDEPVLAEVVGMARADLPVAGVVHNYDFVLGQQGIVGIKTGWTEQAGGCFVFAAQRVIAGGAKAELLGAVLAQPGNAYSGIEAAEQDSVALLGAAWPHLEPVAPIREGELVGEVRSSWGGRTTLLAGSALRLVGWPGLEIRLSGSSDRLHPPLRRGLAVGSVRAAVPGGQDLAGPVVTGGALPGPTEEWRLLDTNL
jgi:D-alanyl-D-alanine carboxypeptidase (penicillin-binding protein 5/6)